MDAANFQFALNDQQSDSRVINIAGRQRMLSQRISKCALLLDISPSEPQLVSYREEMHLSLDLWVKSHVGLQRGDAELGLPGNNSPRVIAMFGKIEPQFQAIVEGLPELFQTICDWAEEEKFPEIERLVAAQRQWCAPRQEDNEKIEIF